jgi:outer membrane biosynthesis protein TonB
VFWPVALFVATEILTRVAWPSGWQWQLLRWAGMVPVAFVAALVSYRHLSGLLGYYGEESLTCVLGPIAVDGLMVMATAAILATGHTQHTTTSEPESVSAVPDLTEVPAPTPAVPAPPIYVPQPVDNREPTTQPAATPNPVPVPRTEPMPTPADVAARVTPSPTSTPLRPTAVRPAPASDSKPRPRKTVPTAPVKPLAASADTPVTAPKPAQLTLPLPVDPALLAKAREIATQYRTQTGTPITANQLAARLRVNTEIATQALAVLDLGPNSPTTPIPTVNGKPVKAAR